MSKNIDQEKLVTSLSIGLSITVFIIKLVTVIFVNSLSFFAEFSDSLLDLISVGITLFALKESKKPPDSEHMFGHSKINSLAGFIQSFILLGLYGGILYTSIRELIMPEEIQTDNSIIGAVSLFGIVIVVFFISRRILQIGKSTKNQAIIAQAQNFRADFYRNAIVIIGLVLVEFNLSILDPILAILISLYGLYNGMVVLKDSANELIDANSLADNLIESLKSEIIDVSGVESIDNFAIRTTGNELDAIITLSLSKNYSSHSLASVNQQIKKILSNRCLSFKTNTYIEIQPQKIEKFAISENYQDIFNIIREIGEKEKQIANIHNIIVEQFHDRILIQYHVNVDPNIPLQQAHIHATSLEEKITQKLTYLQDKKKIDIISHIEPIPYQYLAHSHKYNPEYDSPERIKEEIYRIISKFSEIKKIQSMTLHKIPQGYTCLTVLVFPSQMTVINIHSITELIENEIYALLPEVKICTIHAEPDDIT